MHEIRSCQDSRHKFDSPYKKRKEKKNEKINWTVKTLAVCYSVDEGNDVFTPRKQNIIA
jgi:hypothetical protein